MSAPTPLLHQPPTRKAIYRGRAKIAAYAVACAAAAAACADIDGFMLSLLARPSPYAYLTPYMTIVLFFASCGFLAFGSAFIKLAYKAMPPAALGPSDAERALELAIKHPELEAYRGQVAAMGRSFDTDDLSSFIAFDQRFEARRSDEAASEALALAQEKSKATTAALASTTPLPGSLQAHSERAIGLASQANAATRAELSTLSNGNESPTSPRA